MSFKVITKETYGKSASFAVICSLRSQLLLFCHFIFSFEICRLPIIFSEKIGKTTLVFRNASSHIYLQSLEHISYQNLPYIFQHLAHIFVSLGHIFRSLAYKYKSCPYIFTMTIYIFVKTIYIFTIRILSIMAPHSQMNITPSTIVSAEIATNP